VSPIGILSLGGFYRTKALRASAQLSLVVVKARGLQLDDGVLNNARHADGRTDRADGELGEACSRYMDEHLRNLQSKRIHCDEIWSFVYAKEKNVTEEVAAEHPDAGDVWTWTAIDAGVGHRRNRRTARLSVRREYGLFLDGRFRQSNVIALNRSVIL
jgi:hypothetical protein